MKSLFAGAALVVAVVVASGCGCCNRCNSCCDGASSGASMPPKISVDAASNTTAVAPTPVVPLQKMPQVTGSWAGRWESSHPGHGGGLKCVVKEAGPNKRDAVFTAEFGQVKAYDVKLE